MTVVRISDMRFDAAVMEWIHPVLDLSHSFHKTLDRREANRPREYSELLSQLAMYAPGQVVFIKAQDSGAQF